MAGRYFAEWFRERVAKMLAERSIPDAAGAAEKPLRQIGGAAKKHTGETVPDKDQEGRRQIEQSGLGTGEAGARLVKDDPLPPAAESHNDNSAPGRAEHFVLRLTQADRSSFASLAEKLSLQNMVSDVKLLADFWELRGRGKFSEPENKLIKLLGNMQAEQGEKLGDNLKFRWVSADQDHGVSRLVEDARVHGGAAPKDPWTHIGDGVVEDFMAQHRGPGVLFVYDGGKLTPPTKAEMDADRADPDGKHTYMYAMKAKPGLELKDALVGMIRFDSPGDEKRATV
ncbi:hypothetical protein ACLMAJ_31415 [Nocardia sp. KC 131]|uniref:hypothetical protein n=1 Tax=Nocardia arseniciresistens TaxID=3392119 RepID=UPI00398E7ACE